MYNELRRQASWTEPRLGFYHFRDKDQIEVDIVMEQSGGGIAAVEVKAAATVFEKDFRGLKKLQAAVGKAWKAGIVLYDGEMVLSFGGRMHAVPISAL